MPKEVKDLLEEYRDILPLELPRELPPRSEIDHHIELVPRAAPIFRPPYRMSHAELAKLRKQLDELLVAGFIQPSKSPFGASVLF